MLALPARPPPLPGLVWHALPHEVLLTLLPGATLAGASTSLLDARLVKVRSERRCVRVRSYFYGVRREREEEDEEGAGGWRERAGGFIPRRGLGFKVRGAGEFLFRPDGERVRAERAVAGRDVEAGCGTEGARRIE